MRAFLPLLLLLPLAGCLSGSDGDGTGPSGDIQAPALVDALAAYQAGNQSANVERLGGPFEGGGAEMDAWGSYLFVDAGSVRIFDASDPTALQQVAAISTPADVQDVKVSDDGEWLFIGNDEEASAATPDGGSTRNGGFWVYDIHDKSNPQFVSFLPVGPRRGPHMVTYHRTAAGDELVLGANADVSINRFDRATGTLTELARYQADLATEFNRDPEVFDVLYQGWAHDMFAMEDPAGNRTLLYVANWDAGLRILDLTDPANPVELGGWNDFPEGHSGNLHTVATQWIGDRRITVGSVEVGFYVVGGYHYAMGTERSIVYVWDTTDPASIQLLGTWENPDAIPAARDLPGPLNEGETSTHNLQLEDGRVYMAHYGLGAWVLDVSTPETQSAPALLGFHFEPNDNVWDVLLNDGVLYTSGSVGVVALHYLPDALGGQGIDSRA